VDAQPSGDRATTELFDETSAFSDSWK